MNPGTGRPGVYAMGLFAVMQEIGLKTITGASARRSRTTPSIREGRKARHRGRLRVLRRGHEERGRAVLRSGQGERPLALIGDARRWQDHRRREPTASMPPWMWASCKIHRSPAQQRSINDSRGLPGESVCPDVIICQDAPWERGRDRSAPAAPLFFSHSRLLPPRPVNPEGMSRGIFRFFPQGRKVESIFLRVISIPVVYRKAGHKVADIVIVPVLLPPRLPQRSRRSHTIQQLPLTASGRRTGSSPHR
jgi:hypothetical protein